MISKRYAQPRDSSPEVSLKEAFFRRFRNDVGPVHWDEVILAREEWIEQMCIGVIIVASLYFIPPALITLFLAWPEGGAPWQREIS